MVNLARESPAMVLDVSQDLAPIFMDRLTSLSDLPEWIPLHPFGDWMGNGESIRFDDESFSLVNQRLSNNGNDWHLDIEHDTVTAEEMAAEGKAYSARTAGYITELKIQDGFVYGKVQWTEEIAKQVIAGEWRYVSPVILGTIDDGIFHVNDYHSFALVKRAGTYQQRKIGLSAQIQTKEKQVSKQLALITLAATLALSNEATEDEIISEVSNLKKAKGDLLKLTAAKTTDEALATLASWKANSEQLATVQADLASVKKEQTDAKVSALLNAAEAEFKLTPAQKKAYAEEDAYAHWREKPELLEKHLSALLPIVQGKEAKTKPADNPHAKQVTLAAAVREVKADNPNLDPVAAVVAARTKYPQLKGEVN